MKKAGVYSATNIGVVLLETWEPRPWPGHGVRLMIEGSIHSRSTFAASIGRLCLGKKDPKESHPISSGSSIWILWLQYKPFTFGSPTSVQVLSFNGHFGIHRRLNPNWEKISAPQRWGEGQGTKSTRQNTRHARAQTKNGKGWQEQTALSGGNLRMTPWAVAPWQPKNTLSMKLAQTRWRLFKRLWRYRRWRPMLWSMMMPATLRSTFICANFCGKPSDAANTCW